MHKKPSRVCALTLSALTLSTLVAGISPSYAGPDDGKIVTTKSHVDAPKTFWENDIFTLKNEANVRGNGIEHLPLEKTVNWVGKGWSGSLSSKENQYIFTSNGSRALDFLGEAGKNYYMAPQRTSYNHDPIWAGFGSDSDIPVDKFREGTFALDILSVDGPGTMDFFSYANYGSIPSALHMLSSQQQGLHSYLLQQGTHTHNNTVFSKPGRYEVTYRTVARSADGKESIASKPTVLVWQVGGQQPVSGDGTPTAVSTEDRYKNSPAGDLTSADYKLTLAPHEGREQDGDNKLTDITFTSGSAKEGTLTLYNNGYFLTDLEVKDGKAVWPEMLGSEESDIQAVFTPAEGKDGARWISPAAHYASGKTAEVTSKDGEADWPTKVKDPRNQVLSQDFYTPTSDHYTASIKPAPDDMPGYALLEVKFDDPNFRGFIRGGFYAERGGKYPQAEFEANVVDGVARQYVRASEYTNGTFPKVEVIPHPDMNALRSSVELEGSYESGKSVHSGEGTITLAESPNVQPPAPSPTPADPSASASPSASAEPTASPSESSGGKKCYAPTHKDRSIIDQGHVDLQASLKDGKLGLSLKDDTGIITPGTHQRSLNDVVFTVGENAKHKRNKQMMAPELDFIGEEGSEFYGLPQTQMQGVVWPGYSTENIDYSQVDGSVTLHIEPKTMPKDARFGLYEEGLSSYEVLMNSQDKDTTHEIPFATHAHTNWVFTKAGDYSFDTYYTAKLKDGTEVKSKVEQLNFAVGKQAVEDCATAPAPETSKPASPKETASSSATATTPAANTSKSASPTGNASPSETAPANGGETTSPAPAADSTSTSPAAGTSGNGSDNGQAAGTNQNGSQQSSSSSSQEQKKSLAHTGFGKAVLALVGGGLFLAGAALLVFRRKQSRNS